MRLVEILFALAGLGLGAVLGWFMERSGFSLNRVAAWSRPGIGPDGLRAYALAMILVWLGLSLTGLFSRDTPIAVPYVGLPANLVGGLAAGAATSLLAGGPLSFALRAAATGISALILFLSWCGGVILGSYGVFAPAIEWLQELGPHDAGLADIIGVPQWLLLVLCAAIVFALLLRAPVRVRIGVLEWPKQGTGLGLLLAGGWLLALRGGDMEGLNAVRAIEDIWEGLVGGRLWLQPSLLVGIGFMAWGFGGAVRRRSFFGEAVKSPAEFAFLALSGVLLGLACALAGADPAARAFFGVSALDMGAILFVLAFWFGSWLTGILETRGKE